MDRPRIVSPHRKRIRQAAYAGGALALLLVTLGLSRLKPAAPSVDRSGVLIDAVKRGPMLREVRGLGTLVPEDVRWIPAAAEGRVERILILPGTFVKADSVILELSNPELELQALDAESQLRQAEAQYTELKVRLQSQQLDQRAAAAKVQADFEQAKMQADTNSELARQGLIADLTRKLSDVAARELGNRNTIEQERLSIASEAVEAQLAVQRALVAQRRAEAHLRRSQVKALAISPGIAGMLQVVPVEQGQRVSVGTTSPAWPCRTSSRPSSASRRPRPKTFCTARRRPSIPATGSWRARSRASTPPPRTAPSPSTSRWRGRSRRAHVPTSRWTAPSSWSA